MRPMSTIKKLRDSGSSAQCPSFLSLGFAHSCPKYLARQNPNDEPKILPLKEMKYPAIGPKRIAFIPANKANGKIGKSI